MKQSKTSAALLVFAILSVTVLAVSPASARHASAETETHDSATTTQTTTSTEDSSSGDTTETTTTDDSTDTPNHEHVANKVAELHSQAKAKVAELRQGKRQLTAAQLDKICQNRQTAIDNKIKAFGNAADSHLARLNDVFAKLQAYQTSAQLNASNYQNLVSDATAKQQAATDAVAALKTAGTNVTCTSTDPATNLMAVQSAAQNARDALKAYRTTLKNIVVALAQAQPSTQTNTSTTTSTGGSN